MLIGSYIHSIDAKGRVTIPAKFREDLGDSFVITRGLFGRCITAYSYQRWAPIQEKLMNISMTDKLGMQVQALILGNACECEVDKMGRILIPQPLKNMVGLEKDVTLTGLGNRVEIRNSELWNEMNSINFDDLSEEDLQHLESFELR